MPAHLLRSKLIGGPHIEATLYVRHPVAEQVSAQLFSLYRSEMHMCDISNLEERHLRRLWVTLPAAQLRPLSAGNHYHRHCIVRSLGRLKSGPLESILVSSP